MSIRIFPVMVLLAVLLLCTMATGATRADEQTDDGGFISLFDGKSLEGWTASENKTSCTVENGLIVVGGGRRSHLFYTGPVQNQDFKNFELKLEVLTRPRANSGVYFHTKYQESGWPDKGYVGTSRGCTWCSKTCRLAVTWAFPQSRNGC